MAVGLGFASLLVSCGKGGNRLKDHGEEDDRRLAPEDTQLASDHFGVARPQLELIDVSITVKVSEGDIEAVREQLEWRVRTAGAERFHVYSAETYPRRDLHVPGPDELVVEIAPVRKEQVDMLEVLLTTSGEVRLAPFVPMDDADLAILERTSEERVEFYGHPSVYSNGCYGLEKLIEEWELEGWYGLRTGIYGCIMWMTRRPARSPSTRCSGRASLEYRARVEW